jgi:hypothetical protein
MTPDDSVLRRIRALLAKARHSAAKTSDELRNEAETSLRLAQALMEEHGLSETAVEVQSDGGKTTVHVNPDDMVEEEGFRRKTRTRWDTGLARAAATACGCGTYLHEVAGASRTWLKTVVFYGLPQDIAVARELFGFLRESLTKAVKRYLLERRVIDSDITAGGVEARSLRDGFVRGVNDMAKAGIERQRQSEVPVQARQRAGDDGETRGALFVLTGDLVKAREGALELMEIRLGLTNLRASGPRDRDRAAYGAGVQVGRSVSLSRAAIR